MSNSTNVETNVVQMRFDNKNFEKNVSQTMDSLDKLKKELKFDDSAKSFKTLEENAKKVDFSPLSKGIEKVQVAFSFLDTFSATVYHRLSNRLIDIGKKVTSAVSTEGIRSGFSEYELKMNSFKTIKASAGKYAKDSEINEKLEELNKYADRTIYSFSDMTNNIGKFTNAGVKLDVAVKAIKGISNEAAVSGANAEEASRAMYNFSQALSSGYVKLIDWKSIENANMATEEFKNELIKTAASVGTLTEAQNGMYKTQKGKLLNSTRGFNDALQDQWMTTEVLTKTLEKYANENTDIGKKAFDAAQRVNTFSKLMDTLKESIQSGWSRVWELVVGDLEQATALWTSISDAVGKFIDKRFGPLIKMLDDWNKHGGRERTLIAIKNVLKAIGDLLKPIGKAFRDIFPKKTVNDLLRFTDALEGFAKKVKPTSEQAKKLQDTFRGIFAAISIVLNVIKAFKATFGKFFIRVLGDALHTIFGVTGSLGDMLVQVRKSVIENKTFYKAFQSIVDVLEWVYSGIKKVAGFIWDFVKTIKDALKSLGGFNAFKDWFGGLIDAIKNFDLAGIVKAIWKMFKTIGKAIDKAMAATFDFYTPLKNKIIETKDKIVNSKVVQWVIGLFESMVDGIQKAFDKMKDIKTDGADQVVEETKSKFSLLEGIANVFKKVWGVIKGIFDAVWPVIKDVFKSLGTGIQMLWEGVTSNIKNSDLGDAGGFLGGLGIIGLVLAIREFIKEMKPMFDVFKIFSKGGALTSMFNLLGNLSKLVKAKIIKEIAAAILMLVAALFLLCTLPQEKVAAATITMGVLFQGLTSVFKSIEGATGDIKDTGDAKQVTTRLFGIAAMIAAIAIAMVVLTIAMKKISKLKTEDITKGIIVIMLLFRIIERTVTSILTAGQRLRGSKTGDVNIMVKGVAGVIKSLGKAVLLIAAACWVLAKTMEETDKEGNKTLNPKRIVIPLIAIGALIGLIGFIITKVTAASKPLIEEGSSHNISILNGKGGVALTIIALAIFVKQFAKAFLMLMASVALISIASKFLGWGSLWASFGLMIAAIVSVLAAMLIAVKLLTKMSDEFNKEGKGGLLKVSVLIGLVSLFITAIAMLMAVLSFLPSDWAWTGASALLAISASISMIMLALSAMLKNSFYDLTYDPKGIATIVGSITLSIATLVAAVVVMAKTLAGTDTTKAILILVGIAAGMTAIIAAVGHFQKFARGFELFTKGLAAFGIAAAGFATAAVLIILTLKQISKMSDSEIAAIGENMKKVTSAILTASDQIIGLIMGLVHTVVGTAIGTAVTTIINSSKQIIAGLLELLDIILENAPTLVNKLLQVAVEVLAQFEKGCAPVIAQLVSTVATIISEVAKAIIDNAPKIVSAINDVITAVSTLIVQSIAKIFGIDQFKGAVKVLINIIKPFTAYLLGMFAIAKFKKHANIVATILSSLKTKIASFISTARATSVYNALFHKDDYLAAKEGIAKIKELSAAAGGAAQGTSKAIWGLRKQSAKALGSAALSAAGIALTVGSAIKAVIDGWTEAIDVTTSSFEDIHEEAKKAEDELNDLLTQIKDSAKERIQYSISVDYKYDSAYQLFDRLQKVMDTATGKVKEGKEDEFKKIADEMQDTLGIRIELEDKIAKIIDDQGNKRKADLETLKQLVETEKFKEKLDKQLEAKEELETKRKELVEKRDKYKEPYNYYKDLRDKHESGEYTIDDLNLSILEHDFEGDIEKRNEAIEKVKKEYNLDTWDEAVWRYVMDATGHYGNLYHNAKNAVDDLTKQIQAIEDAEEAYYNGNLEEMQKYSLVFSGYYKIGLTDDQKRKETEKLFEKVQQSMDNVDESIYSEVKGWFDTLRFYKKELGESTADLDKMWETYEKEYNEKRGKTEGTKVVGSNGLTKADLANKVIEWAKQGKSSTDVEKMMKELGVNTAEGFLDGYDDLMKAETGKSSEKNTKDLEDAYKKKLKIGSPSKLFADEIGKWTGEGILVGMEDAINAYDPSSLTTALLTKLQSSIFPAIAGLTGNSIPFGGVTPVNFGLNQNGSGIYGTDLAVNDTLPYDTHLMNITAILQKHSDNMMNQTNTIIEEIGLLRGDVGDLASHIDDLELRLDSDAIVGGLTPKLNNALVRYSNNIGRGQ